MTENDKVTTVVAHWRRRAREALDSARDEARAGRAAYAVNRCYYAAFYAACAVLLRLGKRFVKHSGVRAAVHRDLVKPGLLAAELGGRHARGTARVAGAG